MVWSLRLLFVHCTTPLRACKELQWLHETTRIHNLQNAWIIRWQKVDVPGSFLERSTFRFIVVSDHSLNLHILERTGRERETCEERGSSLFPRLSPFARPVHRLQPRLLFFNPFSFFNVFPFICDQVYFFSNSKLQSSFLPQFSKNTLLNTWKVIPIWRRICSK